MVRLARLGGLDQGQSSSVEIEMTELEGQQREPPHSPTAGLLRTSEYAGSREGEQVIPVVLPRVVKLCEAELS